MEDILEEIINDPLYLSYEHEYLNAEILEQESLIMLNETLQKFISESETFIKNKPSDIKKIVSLYFKKYVGRGLNHLIINFSKTRPDLLLVVSDFKDELVKPLNPRLIFRFIEIHNEEDKKIIFDIIKAFSRNLIFDDREVIVRINLPKMIKTLELIKYDFTQLSYIEPFWSKMDHVHTTIVECNSDDEDESEEEEEELTDKEKKEKRRRDRKKTEYDSATSSVVKDFYMVTIFKAASKLYEAELRELSQSHGAGDIKITDEMYATVDKNDLIISNLTDMEIVRQHSLLSELKKTSKKMNKIILDVYKEMFPVKFIKEMSKTEQNVPDNFIRITSRLIAKPKKSDTLVIWRYFHCYMDSNVRIRTIRPFVKMVY